MEFGFEVVGAKRADTTEDAPVQVPMRGSAATKEPRRNVSTDQKKTRRKMQRTAAEHTEEPSMSRESDLLARMAAAPSLTEQHALAAELETVRSQRVAGLRAEASLDLANTVVEERFPTFAPAQFTQHTAATDWLADVEPDEHDLATVEAHMRAEATIWYDGRPDEVKAAHDEMWAQAVGMAQREAGRFGLQAAAAKAAFVGQVEHLSGLTVEGMDEAQKGPFNAPENKVTYPDSPDAFDDAVATGSDPKSTKEAPSLAEGDEPEGDHSESVNDAPAARDTHDSGSEGTQPSTDYIDGTKTPSTVSSKTALSMDGDEDQKSTHWQTGQAPSLKEGDTPEGDAAQPVVEEFITENKDKSPGADKAVDSIDGTVYPKQSALHMIATAALESPEVTGEALTWARAMAALASVDDQFGGVPGRDIVGFFQRHSTFAAEDLKTVLAGEVPESFKEHEFKKDDADDDDSKKESAKTAGAYGGGSPKEGDTATCHKDGGAIQFFDGQWMHLKGTGDSHNDVYPATPKEQADKAKESALSETGPLQSTDKGTLQTTASTPAEEPLQTYGGERLAAFAAKVAAGLDN